MRRLLSHAVIAIVLAITSTSAMAQSNADQELRAGLLDLKNSGPEGSLQVAKMFAQCHGFQSALYYDLTQDVILKLEDSDFAASIAEQAMIDGHMAFLSSVAHTADPKKFVTDISREERISWSRRIDQPGKKAPLVWEKLSLCQKIAPMSRYFVDQIRKRK
jgi:hypothetical protein